MNKRVRKMLAKTHRVLHSCEAPLSTYNILGALCETNPKVTQPTIYPVLSALSEPEHVQRIESRKINIAYQCAFLLQNSILVICSDGETVEENVTPIQLKELAKYVSKYGRATGRYIMDKCSVFNRFETREMPV